VVYVRGKLKYKVKEGILFVVTEGTCEKCYLCYLCLVCRDLFGLRKPFR